MSLSYIIYYHYYGLSYLCIYCYAYRSFVITKIIELGGKLHCTLNVSGIEAPFYHTASHLKPQNHEMD